MTRAYDLDWLSRDLGMIEPNAPVTEMEEFRNTRRVVDLTESDEERLVRGLQLLHEAYEVLAPLNRMADWRLDARKAACSLEEVINGS
jgi:hypothetical protein